MKNKNKGVDFYNYECGQLLDILIRRIIDSSANIHKSYSKVKMSKELCGTLYGHCCIPCDILRSVHFFMYRS